MLIFARWYIICLPLLTSTYPSKHLVLLPWLFLITLAKNKLLFKTSGVSTHLAQSQILNITLDWPSLLPCTRWSFWNYFWLRAISHFNTSIVSICLGHSHILLIHLVQYCLLPHAKWFLHNYFWLRTSRYINPILLVPIITLPKFV